MKNISLILNLILAAAVGYLYYHNFAGNKAAAVPDKIEVVNPDKPLKIAYVDIDTLYEKYTWFKEQKGALEKKLQSARASLEGKETAFMKKVQAFQERAQSGNVPPIELEKEQAKLAAEEQALQKEQGRLAQSLENETKTANDELQQTLENKLKELRSQIGYDYILGYQKGNPNILLTNDSLDITSQVLLLLNAKK